MTTPNTSRAANLLTLLNPARWHLRQLLTDLKVGWKLALIVAVLLLGYIGIVVSALAGLQTLNYHVSNIYDLKLLPIEALTRADSALANIQDQLRLLHGATLLPAEQAKALEIIASSEVEYANLTNQYEQDWLTSKDTTFTQILQGLNKTDLQLQEVQTLNAIKVSYQKYLENSQKFQTILKRSGYDASAEYGALSAILETRTGINRLVELNTQFANISHDQALTAYQRALFNMIATLILATLIGLALTFIIFRSLTSRLDTLTQSARGLERGEYNQNIRSKVTGDDEIGELSQAFDSMATQLTQLLSELETRVSDRTAELLESSKQLTKRAAELEAVSEISNSIASIRDMDELLPRVTELISERFGFYHSGIFTLSHNRDAAVLSAASSEGGRRMMLRNHQLPVGPGSLVGFVASRGIPRIALDVQLDAMHNKNPDLPETRAEMALPLMAGPNLLGVLDVQSTQPAAFSEEDVNILSTLANQVAIAMQNAQLFSETRKALSDAENVYKQFINQGWQQVSSANAARGYRYSTSGVIQLAEHMEEETPIDTRLAAGKFDVPIRLRDQVIGALRITTTDQNREWDPDEIALIQAAADRAALALENARLLEESQRRANKERVIGEISSKISAAANTETILKTAVGELGSLISDTEISIQFTPVNDLPGQI